MPELLLTTPFLKQKSPAKTLHWDIKAYFRNSKRGCQSITNKPLEIIPQVLQGTVTHRLCHVATAIIPREYGWSQSKHPFCVSHPYNFAGFCDCIASVCVSIDMPEHSIGRIPLVRYGHEAKLLCLWQKHCQGWWYVFEHVISAIYKTTEGNILLINFSFQSSGGLMGGLLFKFNFILDVSPAIPCELGHKLWTGYRM